MRKIFKAAAALTVGGALLSTSAFAALGGSAVYNAKTGKIDVNVTGLGTGESTIMVLKSKTAINAIPEKVNDADIVYINQKTAVEGAASYEIDPGTRGADVNTYYVFAGGTNETSATFLGAATKPVAVTGVTILVGGVDKEAAELAIGATAALTATVAPENATDKTVTWAAKQGETDVTATVLSVVNGVETFKAPSVDVDTVYTVTATAGGVTDTVSITVKAATTSVRPKGDIVGSEIGVIDLDDVVAVTQMSINVGTWTPEQLALADVAGTEDGVIDLDDVVAITQRSINMDVTFK